MDAIVVKNLYKRFRLAHDSASTLKQLLTSSIRRRSNYELVEVLKDVSFTVKSGETLAIVGRNGSGKSTLLSLLAHVYRPDEGSVVVDGRIAPLLELGAGFHPDLTGIENIYLNASILGLTRKEVDKRFGSIAEFADIGHFIDAPVRTYSSGMIARLGFAVAIHTDPDVLLVDEVLGVGDTAFQKKCQERIRSFQREGKTIIFVSHDLNSVRSVATRAIWLDRGVMRMDDGVEEVLKVYSAQ